ncbi:glycoside hydrolase family 127 protein [Asticcacaulis sp. SL142]|uniref:glycoside hydrolase family 127 protein n=1 Tax=Asticcacaulis sp. SL142 TaxID=2995155 RepID=UPI00226CE858|nr:glycoside hydrolase family 127 protein [Asticcacaulis sp. SL142]WAC48031.1 glycoside hydrolase family 127 protein [Asticcacaulis sp. SL142]
MFTFSRRATLFTATAFAGAGLSTPSRAQPKSASYEPFPLSAVRLKPSIFLTSIEANQKYLLALEPDRLLHNFRKGAGLEPKGALYGGWEALDIAGHCLGHYYSACSLMYAQTGDERLKTRALYITRELTEVQAKQGDGYAGGTTVGRNGQTVDGKVVYEELRAGDIRTSGFDLNGGWVPIYTYHKVFAGALDTHKYCNDAASLKVAIGLGDYFGKIIEGLSDDQVQEILRAEHGGINESYAELYARTGDKRWLTLSQRLCHKAVLDPLAQGRDELNGKHANTQIPKIVGAARIYELAREPHHAKTALFFWETVTKDHSYVIGGNSDHEHFGLPRQLSTRLDQQTCEACNTYNMLRLTRHLYGWSGDARYFDFYERAHLNHIMSQQDPATGMFSYFSPLVSGFGRVYSDPENDFWCCVGTGMESHSKHGESIYWKSGNRVAINLYYASSLNWAEKGFKLDMDTAFPLKDTVSIRVTKAPKKAAPELALRVPVWAKSPSLSVNGKAVTTAPKDGYLTLTGLKTGDVIALTLPMTTYHEAMPDDANLVAYLSGPLVLAADLGPMREAWEGYDPAIVADSAENLLKASSGDHIYSLGEKGRPDDLTLRPYFAQHNNRTAVYFRRFSPAEWQTVEVGYKADAKARAAFRAATVDHIRLGEQQPEKDHNFVGTPNTAASSHISLRGRIINRGYFQFDMAVAPSDLTLQVTYAGRDRNKDFKILIDGQPFVHERLEGEPTTTMNTKTYPLPAAATQGKSKITVRFEAERDQWTSVYDARVFRTGPAKI